MSKVDFSDQELKFFEQGEQLCESEISKQDEYAPEQSWAEKALLVLTSAVNKKS